MRSINPPISSRTFHQPPFSHVWLPEGICYENSLNPMMFPYLVMLWPCFSSPDGDGSKLGTVPKNDFLMVNPKKKHQIIFRYFKPHNPNPIIGWFPNPIIGWWKINPKKYRSPKIWMVNPRYHQLPSIICMNPKNPRYSVVPQVLFSWLIAQAALLVSKSWQILFTSSWRASGQALNKMGGRKCCWAVGPYPGYIYICYIIL